MSGSARTAAVRMGTRRRPTPSLRDRRRAEELAAALRTLGPGTAVGELLSGPLVELLDGTRGGSYSLRSCEDQLRVQRIDIVGLHAQTYVSDFERQLGANTVPCLLYDANRPEPKQRNAVVQLDPRTYTPGGRALFARHGMADCWQLRALVCEGPSLLAWVGALREAPFTPRERLLFRAVLPAIRERLLLERRLGEAPLALAALPAALEAAGTPAFVLGPSGAVLLANTSARSLRDGDRRGVLDALRADVEGRGPGRFAVTRLGVPGGPLHYLAVLRPGLTDPAPRAAAFAARCGLTARQAEVVGLVARGLANKTIAARLRCAESTVEMHLTAVFARVQVATRAELVARVWSERGDGGRRWSCSARASS